MYTKARSGRNAFTFSRKGMSTIASFGPAPAIADDRINAVIDEKLGRQQADQPRTTVRHIENALVRLFVPGARRTA